VLGPRIGQQPAEPEPDRDLPANDGQSLAHLGEHPLGTAQELLPGFGELDMPRGAFEQSHLKCRLELLDRAGQRRLGDQELLGRARERPLPRDSGERPEMTQLDIHAC